MPSVTNTIPVRAKFAGWVDFIPDDGEFIPAHSLITQVFPSAHYSDDEDAPNIDHAVNIDGTWCPNVDEDSDVDRGDVLGWIIPAPDARPVRERNWLDERWAKHQRRFRGANNYATGVVKQAEADLETLDLKCGRHTGFLAVIGPRRDWGREIVADLDRARRSIFRAQASALRTAPTSASDDDAFDRQLVRADDLRKRMRRARRRALRHATAGARRGHQRGATRRTVIETLIVAHEAAGRYPRARELAVDPQLPSYGTIHQLFGGLRPAIAAAEAERAKR